LVIDVWAALDLVADLIDHRPALVDFVQLACQGSSATVTASERRSLLAAAATGCLPMPAVLPEFFGGADKARTPHNYGLRTLRKPPSSGLTERVKASLPAFDEEVRAFLKSLGIAYNMDRDSAALCDGTISQVDQFIYQFAGMAAVHFDVAPSLRMFANGRLLAQFFAFLGARGRKESYKLVAARHALRLVRYNGTALAESAAAVSACDALSVQMLRLCRQLTARLPRAVDPGMDDESSAGVELDDARLYADIEEAAKRVEADDQDLIEQQTRLAAAGAGGASQAAAASRPRFCCAHACAWAAAGCQRSSFLLTGGRWCKHAPARRGRGGGRGGGVVAGSACRQRQEPGRPDRGAVLHGRRPGAHQRRAVVLAARQQQLRSGAPVLRGELRAWRQLQGQRAGAVRAGRPARGVRAQAAALEVQPRLWAAADVGEVRAPSRL
jgi:hypothetical protein